MYTPYCAIIVEVYKDDIRNTRRLQTMTKVGSGLRKDSIQLVFTSNKAKGIVGGDLGLLKAKKLDVCVCPLLPPSQHLNGLACLMSPLVRRYGSPTSCSLPSLLF